jgi:hypothetical protein
MAQSSSTDIYHACGTVPLPFISTKLGRMAKSLSPHLHQAYGTVPLPLISAKLGRMAQSPFTHIYHAYGTVTLPSSLQRLWHSPPPSSLPSLWHSSPPLDLYQPWQNGKVPLISTKLMAQSSSPLSLPSLGEWHSPSPLIFTKLGRMAQSVSSHLYQAWENGTVRLLSSLPSLGEWHSLSHLISTKLGRMAQSPSP